MPERQTSVTEGNAARSALPVRAIVASAARAGRRDFWRILAIAVAVSTVTALAEIVVVDHLIDPTDVPLALAVGLTASGVSLVGTVFLSGFLSRLIGGAEHGRERATVGQVARTLPWGRLVLADLLVVLIVVVGLIALVIPGLIAVNLLAVVGPVIEIEDRGVFAALRRSARLVRQHFWPVALLATLPVIVASEVESVIPEPASLGAILEVLAIRGLGEGLIEAAIGLTLVELCYRLIDMDRTRPGTEGDEPGGTHETQAPVQQVPEIPGSPGEQTRLASG